MQYRILGKTGLRVSVLGFGGAEIGYENAPDADVERIVRCALDAGMNVIDTAACYGDSEAKLGRALAGRRGDVLIFTKCGHASGLPSGDWTSETIGASIDRSLQRLRTDYVDVIQLHSCSRDELKKGDVVDALHWAKDAGKVRWLGYSGDSSDAAYAIDMDVFQVLQTSVNIADQESVDKTLPRAREKGMGVIAKRPLANAASKYSGLPANPYHHVYWRRLQELRYEFLKRDLDEAISIALRFTLSAPGVDMAIAGTKSPERMDKNARIVDEGPLPVRTYNDIRRVWASTRQEDWEGQT